MNRRKPHVMSLMLLTLTALLLAGTMSAAAAPPAQELGARNAVFGEVVANDAGVLTVRTKDGDVAITVTAETKVRGRGGDGMTRPDGCLQRGPGQESHSYGREEKGVQGEQPLDEGRVAETGFLSRAQHGVSGKNRATLFATAKSARLSSHQGDMRKICRQFTPDFHSGGRSMGRGICFLSGHNRFLAEPALSLSRVKSRGEAKCSQ